MNLDRDAALMACADLPFDKVVEVLTGYLAGRKLERDYKPFLEALTGVRTGIEQQASGRVAEAFDRLLADITALVDENIRCQQMAKDAVELSRKTDDLVEAKYQVFMDEVRARLDGYLKSGTVGMRALAQEFMDSMHGARAKL